MKKIFTLMLSLGCLTAVFAQTGRHNYNGNQNQNGQIYQSWSSGSGNDHGSNFNQGTNSNNRFHQPFYSNNDRGRNQFGRNVMPQREQDRYMEERDNQRFSAWGNSRMRRDDHKEMGFGRNYRFDYGRR